MKEVVYNYDNIKEIEISDTIKRVKIMLINSEEEVLLAFSSN